MSVVRTALRALSATFDHVSVFHLRANDGAINETVGNTSFEQLASTRWSRPRHAVRAGLVGRHSLNEMAGIDGAQCRQLMQRLSGPTPEPELFVLDGLRAAAVMANVGGAATLVDLDDLLSARYRAWAELPFAQLPFDIFGTKPSSPVNRVARVLRPALPLVLRTESRSTAKLEADICARASAVSLVSPTEAATLAARIGRPVETLPMSVAVPSQPTWQFAADPTFDAVFLGRVTHISNLASLDWFGREVIPQLHRLLGRRPVVGVVGKVTPPVEHWLRSLGIEPLGFVPDLSPVFASAAVAIAPQVFGGGVNTKVLDYAALGIPVVGTSRAFSGILHADECAWNIADDPEKFAETIISLRGDGRRATASGNDSHRHIKKHYSSAAADARWASAFRRAVQHEERISV
jgi:Glycosyl transferases group 1